MGLLIGFHDFHLVVGKCSSSYFIDYYHWVMLFILLENGKSGVLYSINL